MENYSDDFISLLSEKDLLSGILPSSPTALIDSTNLLPESVGHGQNTSVINQTSDHRYCRSPLQSDSGLSDGPHSPPLSETNSEAHSPLSSDSGRISDSEASLQRSNSNQSRSDDPTTGSPLGAGMEDLQMSDIDLGTLDTTSLFANEDLFRCIPDTSSVNLGMFFYICMYFC